MRRHAGPGIVFIVALAALAGTAAAGPRIVKGGPRSNRGAAEAALADAATAMAVCWRGSPPSRVRVKVAVDAGGVVTASAITRGGAAQCAAGVLAVWSVPGGAWSGEVEIPAGAAPQDLAASIQQQLLAHSASIKACQAQAPSASGPVGIKMTIHPDGTITDVDVSSQLGGRIDSCVARAVGAVRLDALAASAPIKYQLAVAFSGKGEAEAPDGGGPRPPPPEGGSVAGGLPVKQVRGVLDGARARLHACGKKGKAKGKVVTRFTVRPDGTTKNVVVKEPIGDKGIEDCLVGVYRSLRFPTATSETKVSYPVAFN